jgi:hypothetical protein
MNESPSPRPDAELDALFALARENRPDTSAAEYAFETRLMARLRTQPETGSIWAKVSWRMIPFFAVCVVALTLWQAEASSEANDAATIAGLNNPVAADLWNN